MFDVALLFVADVVYRPDALLAAAGSASTFVAALAAALTSIYLWGMLERRDQTVLRMGVDSAAVLVLYACGLVVLFLLR
jgi:cation:H+ antiporter